MLVFKDTQSLKKRSAEMVGSKKGPPIYNTSTISAKLKDISTLKLTPQWQKGTPV